MQGIAVATADGFNKGRLQSINPTEVEKLAETMGPAAIAKHLGVARSRAYRVLGPN